MKIGNRTLDDVAVLSRTITESHDTQFDLSRMKGLQLKSGSFANSGPTLPFDHAEMIVS